MENQIQPTLGSYLKSLRKARALSLRDVEERSGISNAFLSQLESGKVKRPSPVVLYKLAELYRASYETLMELAGYPVPNGQTFRQEPVSAIFRRFGEITEEEAQALLEYLAFLRSFRKKGRT